MRLSTTHRFRLLIAESMKENALCAWHFAPSSSLTAQPLTPFTFVKNSAPLSGPGALSLSLPRSRERGRRLTVSKNNQSGGGGGPADVRTSLFEDKQLQGRPLCEIYQPFLLLLAHTNCY